MASTTGFAHTEMKIATEFKSCSVPREHRQKNLKEGPHSAGVSRLGFFLHGLVFQHMGAICTCIVLCFVLGFLFKRS